MIVIIIVRLAVSSFPPKWPLQPPGIKATGIARKAMAKTRMVFSGVDLISLPLFVIAPATKFPIT